MPCILFINQLWLDSCPSLLLAWEPRESRDPLLCPKFRGCRVGVQDVWSLCVTRQSTRLLNMVPGSPDRCRGLTQSHRPLPKFIPPLLWKWSPPGSSKKTRKQGVGTGAPVWAISFQAKLLQEATCANPKTEPKWNKNWFTTNWYHKHQLEGKECLQVNLEPRGSTEISQREDKTSAKKSLFSSCKLAELSVLWLWNCFVSLVGWSKETSMFMCSQPRFSLTAKCILAPSILFIYEFTLREFRSQWFLSTISQ